MGYTAKTPFRQIKTIDLSSSDTVNAGTTDTQTLTPGANEIYEILNIYWYVPSIGGATGNHDIEILDANDRSHIYVQQVGTTFVAMQRHILWGASKSPPNELSQVRVLSPGCLFATPSLPLKFRYNNDTDTNQTGNRILEITVGVR